MSALSDKGITLEGLAAAVDSLRQELATWKALARKQDQLTADQITATQSGATAAKISQIAVNTAAIQSLAAQVAGQISLAYVTTLPATGEPLTLYLVPQGDGTAPNFCNEYLWINNAWELIGTTGAMANNGELTIQVNGVTVGTFTANQATNAAVNIAVPTNTNQLTNGAGFVDTAALQAALLLKQNSLNTAQLEAVNSGITAALVTQIGTNQTAIAGKQDALTTAQQAAVDSGATVAKIDQIASNASAIVALTSSKQEQLSTTQLAAVNSGVTAAAVQQIGTNASNISGLQTAVSGKAADNAVVHLAGAETISGDKTWTGINAFTNPVHAVTNQSVPITENPSAEIVGNNFRFIDNDRFWGQFVPVWGTDGSFRIELGISNWSTAGAQGYWSLSTKISKDFGTLSFYTSHANANLGTPSNSWNTVWTQAVRVPGTSNTLILAAMETWEDGARIFMYGKDNTNGSTLYADIDHDDGNHSKTGVTLNKYGFYPAGVSRHLGLADANNRWLTFNGVNPGALCLQNFNAGITLDTTNWDMTGKYGADANFWTPTVNGWLTVLVNGTPGAGWVQLSQGDSLGQFSVCLSTGYAWATIPVIANWQCKICLLCSTVSAKFYPCLGNV